MSKWLQTVIQDHAQALGISEAKSQELAESLLPFLLDYHVVCMPTYIDDSMWTAVKDQVPQDYPHFQSLYAQLVKDYTQRK